MLDGLLSHVSGVVEREDPIKLVMKTKQRNSYLVARRALRMTHVCDISCLPQSQPCFRLKKGDFRTVLDVSRTEGKPSRGKYRWK